MRAAGIVGVLVYVIKRHAQRAVHTVCDCDVFVATNVLFGTIVAIAPCEHLQLNSIQPIGYNKNKKAYQ